MDAHFAEVLARENESLASVTDAEKLSAWRDRVVAELMDSASPYALAMRQTGDLGERARFLDSWGRLIARTVGRILQADSPRFASALRTPHHVDLDPHKTAVLILAALHGGATLSQVAQDSWPLNAALDIALAPFTAPADW